MPLFRGGQAPTEKITSKDVSRALRQTVFPALKHEGFLRRTTRTAWRDLPQQIDVITFWSHNSYNAGALGVTTVSFQVMLGVFPLFRASDDTPQTEDGLRPQEYICDFRRLLRKPFEQEETDRSEIWFIYPDGSNLGDVVEAVRDSLLTEGLTWFESLRGLDRMLDTARRAPEGMDGTWGMGNLGSPHRRELLRSLEGAIAASAEG